MKHSHIGFWFGAVCLLGALSPVTARAESGTTRIELAEMEAKVATSYIVGQLGLTPSQKQQLLSIREQIAPDAEKYLKRRKAWHKSTEKTVHDFVEYSTRTGEFPPKSIQDQLWEYDGEWLSMPRDFRQGVSPVVDRFGEYLTTKQVQRLKEAERHKDWLPGGSYVFTDWPTELRTEADAPEPQRLAAIAQHVKVTMLTRAGYLCSAPYLEEALGERSSSFPHWWDMREHIAQQKRIMVTLDLTFLTGMNLSADQLAEVVKILRKYLPRTGRVSDFAEDMNTAEARKYTKLLKRAVKRVDKGRAVDRDLVSELHDARDAWHANQAKFRNYEKSREAERAIAENVWELLSASQIARMAVTEDCPIPSQNVKGISRAGQVASDQVAQIGKLMDQVRRSKTWDTPTGDRWWQGRVEWLTGGKANYGRMTPEEQETARQNATTAAERVRGMSAAEYIGEREKICTELLGLNLAGAATAHMRKEAADEAGRKKVVQRKIYKFFICNGANLLALSEARLGQLGGGTRRR